MVHSLKMGWMKPRDAKTVDDGSKKFYMLWQTDDQGGFHVRNGIIKSLANSYGHCHSRGVFRNSYFCTSPFLIYIYAPNEIYYNEV